MSEIINHIEANLLAHHKRHESNLARCYLDIEAQRDELLEALEYLMYWLNNGLTPPSQSIKTAREILAKAKGE